MKYHQQWRPIDVIRIILTTLMLFSFLHAKNYFIKQPDICDKAFSEKCSNDFRAVRNLQIALNRDKKLNIHIKEDGKWGEETKKAVIAFQKAYHLSPADGVVGRRTKVKLDQISRKIKFPKDKQVKHVALMTKKRSKGYATYAEFKRKVNLRRSYQVFQDKRLLKKANGRNTVVKIDVSEQRVKLLVNGKVALCAPCTTGAKRKFEPNTKTYRDKHTPLGTYRITEKVAAKRSTIFGEMYRNGKKVYHGDRRKYRGPKAKYVGHVMHHWMRLTSGGIGMHASRYIKRHPGSNGCVRLPPKVAKTIFAKVRKGTKVMVVN